MKYEDKRLFKYQNGAAALVTTIVLLIAVTLVVMFAARVGLLDQKMSGNEFRHKEAFVNAEAALDEAASFLRANPALHDTSTVGWVTCTGSTSIFPCDTAGAEMVYGNVTVGTSITDTLPVTSTNAVAYLVKTSTSVVAMGVGASDDGTGAAVVQVAYAKTSLLTPGELPPLMLPSGDLSGNFNIVPNPNGGGDGVPISVWAEDTLDTTGANWKTCDHGEFTDSGSICMDTKADGDSWAACSCDAERSNSTNVTEDIVLYPDASFPTSPFAYVFGNDGQDQDSDGDFDGADVTILKAEIQARAEATGLLLADCTTIDTSFNGLDGSALVWVTGDCDIGSNIIVGSRDKPIILVVAGDIRINAGAEVWGVIIGLAGFVLNGGPVIHGSAISEIESDLTNGTYSQVYDKSVFENLREDTINTEIAKMSYSWHDFTPE